jgi:hypothetical protein
MEKREQIEKWFKIKNDAHQLYMIASICMAFMAIAFLLPTISGEAEKPGVALIVICFCLIVSYFSFRKYRLIKDVNFDSQLDSWLEEDIQEVIKYRPYDKLGISKEDLVAESLLVVGPVYWNVSGFDVKDIIMKKGKDGFNRYSIWTIQVFCFTENYLSSYKCHYNWIKNTYINESTNEFFYKDVVSVKTDTISSAYTLMNGQRLVHSEAFQLKLTGDEITVITNDASLNTSSVMVSKAERAVQSIRAMLRDKKK